MSKSAPLANKATQSEQKLNTLGPGRVLIAVYAIFALAATVRSSYQLFTAFDKSPVNYSLSVLSGLVYILATVALAKPSSGWQKVARATLGFELAGVLLVGTYSLFFPVASVKLTSVWSNFGMYYGFVPLALPIIGLYWLAKRGRG
jgi:hypothetical protein